MTTSGSTAGDEDRKTQEIGILSDLEPRPLNDDLHTDSIVLNMGPAHPATHGTVRLQVELEDRQEP